MLKTFKHMKNAESLKEAMLLGGYSEKSSIDPSKNFLDREGVKPLIEQYRTDLINAGLSTEMLAEIQAEGLFDQNAAVRLGYLRETKKDFGIAQEPSIQVNQQFNAEKIEIVDRFLKEVKDETTT